MNFYKLICVVVFFLGSLAYAEEPVTAVMQANVTPKWKASFDSYFYDFEGERAPRNNLYEFGDTTLKMQLMGLQYQTDNGWTVMALATYLDNYVVTKIPGLPDSEDSTRGLADTAVLGIKTFMPFPSVLVLTDVGVSLPTGSINEKNPFFTAGDTNYAYNMQMGSGTYDILLGAASLYLQPKYQLGGRVSTILRTTGYNSNGYRLGNQYKAEAWLDIPIGTTGLTPRLVGYYKHRNGIRGQDESLSNPAFRPALEYYYHNQINYDVSVALQYKKAFSPTFSMKAEAGIPVTQDCINYDDVAIFTQYYATLGMTGTF